MSWFNNFFQVGPIPENAMQGEYDIYLVALSYFIACLASFVALDMSAHLRKPTSMAFWIIWLIVGSFIMGAGIWSMHFVGMLAFKMDMPMSYSSFWTILSMVVAIFTAAAAFLFFIVKNPTLKHYVLSGIILGIAIPTMHYTGMAGMNNVVIHYRIVPFLISILVAIIAALAALWLSIKSDSGTFNKRLGLKLGSGLIMGLAIVGMHYVGMYAAVFSPSDTETVGFSLDPVLLSILIATVVISITLIGLILSIAKYFLTAALEKEKDFLSAVLDNIKAGVVACDNKGNIILTNRALENLVGKPVKNVSVVTWRQYFPLYQSNDQMPLEESEYPLRRALNGNDINGIEVMTFDRAGKPLYLLVEGQQLIGRDQGKYGAVVVYHDISKLKLDEKELEYRATHDLLTGLPNKTLLLDRIKQSIAYSTRNNTMTMIIFADLDNFKYTNDALGHAIGDLLLKAVAIRFQNSLRSTDTIARIGGDEFVIVLTDQDINKDSVNLFHKILDIVAEPYEICEHELRVTCSLGISIFPDDAKDADTLLQFADTAMYQAKEAGKNTFKFYTKDMFDVVKKRLNMEHELRNGILNNDFFLEYQAKFDIKKNSLIGFEALIRWQHPELGIIYPSKFISVAESTGLIIPIGRWVLKAACMQNKAWQDAGLPKLGISVNLSSRQCKDRHLMSDIKQILQETELAPEYLELELTESLAMTNPIEFMAMLTECKNLGIKTSIDDFGTGYSSLNYLRKFPVNTLKIDQSFISELSGRNNDLSIVKAIITLGHSLKLNVIAEGVETAEQLRQLKDIGCDEIQGFLFNKPISAEAMTNFIKNQLI